MLTARLPATQLPATIEPHMLAAREASLEGELPVAAFARLADVVGAGSAAKVRVQLQFLQDDHGYSMVTGSLEVPVLLRCERCLEQVEHDLVARIDALLVSDDASAGAVSGRDVIVLEDPEGTGVATTALLEDELLLSMPMVACRAGDGCPRSPAMAYGPLAEGADASATGSRRPFSALREMLDSGSEGVS